MRLRSLIIVLMMAVMVSQLAVAGVSASGNAQETRKEGVFGTLIRIDGANIILDTKTGEVEVVTTSDTQFKVPGLDVASLEDILEDDRVAVFAAIEGDTLTGIDVLKIPNRPARHLHVVGVVEEVIDGTVRVVDKEGNTFNIELPEDAPAVEVGAVVTSVSRRGPRSGRLESKAIERIKQVVERLENQIGRLEQKVRELEGQLKQKAEERLTRVKRSLEDNADRKLSALDNAVSRSSGENKARLNDALENASRDLTETTNKHGVRPPMARIAGIISGVDLDSGSIGIEIASGRVLELTVTEATEIKFTHEDKDALEDLNPGDQVVARYNPHTKEALSIVVNPPEPVEVDVIIASVDVATFTLTIVIPERGEFVISADERTKILKDGNEARLEDLEPRDLARVRAIPATRLALSINARSPRPIGIKGVIVGLSAAIDEEPPKVTVNTPEHRGVTVNITRSTRIIKDEHEASFADLAVGDVGGFQLDPTTHNALAIEVHSLRDQTIAGIIGAIDLTSEPPSIVIVNPRHPEKLALKVDTSTVIEKDGNEHATLRDLALEDIVVKGTFNPATRLISRLVVQSPPTARVTFTGVLTETSGHTWTVDETEIVLSRATRIRGKPDVGDTLEVVAVMRPDGNLWAVMIIVEGEGKLPPVRDPEKEDSRTDDPRDESSRDHEQTETKDRESDTGDTDEHSEDETDVKGPERVRSR